MIIDNLNIRYVIPKKHEFTWSLVSNAMVDGIHKSTFRIEGPNGTGHNIAVTLRRTLLSNIPGAAVVAMKVVSAKHQFDVLPGVRENMLDIQMNLKDLFLQLAPGVDSMILQLDYVPTEENGGRITAKMFGDLSDQITVFNPDMLICNSSQPIYLEIFVANGVGYVTSEKHQFFPDLTTGWIRLDSIFSPVLKCGYEVSYITSKANPYDVVHLQLDSKVPGLELFVSSVEHMLLCFDQLLNKNTTVNNVAEETPEILSDEINNIHVSKLGLSPRVTNVLLRNDFRTVGELSKVNQKGLLSIIGLGAKGAQEIVSRLNTYGVMLGNNDKDFFNIMNTNSNDNWDVDNYSS